MNIRSRISIFDTLTTRTTIPEAQLTEMINFLIFNRTFKMGANETKALTSVRPLTSTVIGSLFTKAIELRKETLFGFINIPKTVKSIPEILTYTHVTFDMKQLNTAGHKDLYETISKVPEFANNICFNVTPMLRDTGVPTDALSFQSLFVRDLLSRSYFDNKSAMWLTPSLIRYMCRFYNMSLSTAIGSVYNLTWKEQQAVATVFSLFFLQQVSDTATADAFIRSQKLGLGSAQEVSDILARVKDVLSADAGTPSLTSTSGGYEALTLDSACAAINGLGIGRLESVNRKFLFTRMRNIGPDVLTSSMALEYPPYFAYLILIVLSGRMTSLTTTLKRNDLQKDGLEFQSDFVKSHSFIPAL